MIRIDRASGKPVFGTWPDDSDPKAAVSWDAFKPESGDPRRAVAHSETADKPRDIQQRNQDRGDSDFLQRQG
ncbi:hypothetical protein ABTD78_22530, partial [Acinetobacter baumannii]